jgi:hypothetical protein
MRSNSIWDAYFLCFRGWNIDFKNKLLCAAERRQRRHGRVAVVVVVVVAISRDKANCKWTSEKGIKLAARRLWQLDYTLIDCEPPFSTYTLLTHELVAALCDAIAVTNPSEAHRGKRIASAEAQRAASFYMQNALLWF